MPDAPDAIAELEKAEEHLLKAYQFLSAEQFLIESTDNLKRAHDELKEAGAMLHDQLAKLRELKKEL